MANDGTICGFDALDKNVVYDVCIVGSGPAGTVLGTDLVKKGVKTIILESGEHLSQWLFKSVYQKLAAYDYTGDTNYPLTKTKARLIGGNSNFWTGRCERLHPTDFQPHPYTPSENPWPITYSDMEPYYQKAEISLNVRGGKRSESAPPRQGSYPLPPHPNIAYLQNFFSKADVIVDDSPTATPQNGVRFFRVQKELLPKLLSHPEAVLVKGATATKLIPDSDNKIACVECRSIDGSTKLLYAKYFVLAGGGIENPRLLLLSKSEYYPSGIGNSSDMVGRGFNEHPGVNFYAKSRHEIGTIVPTNKIGRSHQFYDRFRSEGLGSILPVFRQSWILPHHMYEFKLSNVPKNTISILRRFIKPTIYIGATIEQKISRSNRVKLSEHNNDPFGNPLAHLIFNYSPEDLRLLDRCRELILEIFRRVNATEVYETEVAWSRHHQGTCRMGNDPKHSVVDKHLRIHDTRNLYICGADAFVTGGAMQPCLTIAALAHRLADHLPERLSQG